MDQMFMSPQNLYAETLIPNLFDRVTFKKWLGHGFPGSSAGKESACKAGDPSLIPGSGRSSGEGIGYPLQYSGLENFMDCIDGVTKSQTRLSDFHFHFVPLCT